MNPIEVKKAWNTMKRNMSKELGLTSGYVMSQQQLAKCTATYQVCSDKPYEDMISNEEKWIAYVENSSHTPEWKAETIATERERIAAIQARKSMYGTKINEARETLKAIEASESFAKFQKAVGPTRLSIDTMNNAYYIRFNY